LSINAKQPFYSSSPKAPFDEDAILSIPEDRLNKLGNDVSNEVNRNITQSNVADHDSDISNNFCVVVFIPYTIDYLYLKSKPQQRCLYDIRDNWKERIVNP
jgi:hypothetical protein